jgi:hypothetical protein
MHSIQYVSPDALKRNPRNAHTHSKKQTHQIADSIVACGFATPVLIDESSQTPAQGVSVFEVKAALPPPSLNVRLVPKPDLQQGTDVSGTTSGPAGCATRNRLHNQFQRRLTRRVR